MQLPREFNVATYFIDRNVLDGRGKNVAIECGEQKVTYAQLLERVNRVGNALREYGVRPEERVVILLPDRPEFLYSFFGAIKIGSIAVPVNTLLRPSEYEYILRDTRAAVVIVDESLLGQIQNSLFDKRDRLNHILIVGEAPAGYTSFREVLERAAPDLAPAATHKDEAAFWLYSSGSTYFPNGSLYGLDVSCAVTILIGALRYSNPCSATSPCRPSRGPRRMREMSSSPEHCFIIISLF